VFVFLLLEEHPYGREMLRQLLEGGFLPELILQEAGPLADREREKFLEPIEGHPVAPTVAAQVAEHGIRVVSVTKHDDENCLGPVREVSPDLLVLGGTRIIRGRLLESAADGVLNSHPGLLPECRGSASPAWSVYHDIPIGSSCHFCSEAIDEGDIVGRRRVAVRRGDTYEDLCYKTLVMAGTLMVEAMRAYADGRLEAQRGPQGSSPHPTFRNMPDELLDVVRQKLREQTYLHYDDSVTKGV
jgi:methionyl-tRNA formyltransferase